MSIVEDKMEILELCARQDNAYDSVDLNKFLGTWTEDAVFNSNAFGIFKGREALKEWFLRFQQIFNGKRHLLTNHEIHVNGATATMYCYLTVIERVQAPRIIGTATFTDQLRKEVDGKWRFTRRDQVVDPSLEANQSTAAAMDRYREREEAKRAQEM